MKIRNLVFCQILTTLLVIGLISCTSTGAAMKNLGTVPLRSLSEKTLILEIGMAEWDRAILPLVDAGIYNAGLNGIANDFNIQQAESLASIHSQLSLFYGDLYQAEVVNAQFPFEITGYITDSTSRNFFDNLDSAKIQKIMDIGAANDAKYVLAIVGQMSTLGVSAFGINGNNRLYFNMALFDASGNIAAKGVAYSSLVNCASKDINTFISLFTETTPYLQNMLRGIGN